MSALGRVIALLPVLTWAQQAEAAGASECLVYEGGTPRAAVQWPDGATAVPAGFSFKDYYGHLRCAELSALAQQSPAGSEGGKPAEFRNVRTSAPPQSVLSGLTNVERLSAALKTDIEDVEAGLQVAPFIDKDEPWSGMYLQLAALEDGVTRLGAGVAFQGADEPQKFADLQDEEGKPLACEMNLLSAEQAIIQAEGAFSDACKLPTLLPALPGEEKTGDELKKSREGAEETCSLSNPAGKTFEELLAALKAFLKDYEKRLKDTDDATVRQHANMVLGELARSVDMVRKFKVSASIECPEPETVKAAVKRWEDSHESWDFGAGVRADFFPLVWGSVPACEATPDEPKCKTFRVALQRFEPLAAVTWSPQKWSVTLGAGLAWAREERGADLDEVLSPKLGVSYQFSDSSSEDDPRVVAGLELELDVALGKPESQKELVNELSFIPYIDVTVTDELSFRLGVPLHAEQVAGEEEEGSMTPPPSALQWTLPVFVATVIKLD
jgi:hypothetical protein